MKSLKVFFSKPTFILVPFFLASLIIFIQPILIFPVAKFAKNGTPFVGFPLSFAEVIDLGGVDGTGYNFSILPLIIDGIFYYGVFLLLMYWISKANFFSAKEK